MKHRKNVQEVEKILIYITNSVACKLKLLSVFFFFAVRFTLKIGAYHQRARVPHKFQQNYQHRLR